MTAGALRVCSHKRVFSIVSTELALSRIHGSTSAFSHGREEYKLAFMKVAYLPRRYWHG